MNPPQDSADATVDMEEYKRTVPLWKRVHQHSLTQMMLISVQAFCGPAMADAIAGTSGPIPLVVSVQRLFDAKPK
jgi:hypothetical protein